MPYTSYALLQGIRSHRIDSPVIPHDGAAGRPNACNLCHLDKSLSWTAGHLSDWYGIESPKLATDDDQIAASLLWLLRGDAAQRVITAWHFGWAPAQTASGRDWLAPFMAQLLNDPYSAVRFVAYRTLRGLPGFADFSYDYVGDLEQRAAAVQSALLRWDMLRQDQEAPAAYRELLMDNEGRLNDEEISRPQAEMNTQPIFIAE